MNRQLISIRIARTAGVLIVCLPLLNFHAAPKPDTLQFPCDLFRDGSRRIYNFKSGNLSTVQDVAVINKNDGLIKVVVLSKEKSSSSSYSQKTTYNYITASNTTYLSDFSIETTAPINMTMKYRYKNPQAFCGNIPNRMKDTLQYEGVVGNNIQSLNLPPQETTVRFFSTERTQVPAGTFTATVFEKKMKWTDNAGSDVTQITLLYFAEKAGLIKEVRVEIRKLKEIEYSHSKEVDEQISKGLADLENGKKITEIDFFKEPLNDPSEEVLSSKTKIYKTLSVRELVVLYD